MDRYPVFDLDGTLVDSDEALVAPFLALGVPRADVTFGRPLAEECARLGLSVDDYLAHYDTAAVAPFPGVEAMLARLPGWAVCSNKHPASGLTELERLGWRPDAATFAHPGRGAKSLRPVLDELGLSGADVLFVGDTSHDRSCATQAGARFALAGWNPRAAPQPGDLVLAQPADVLAHL